MLTGQNGILKRAEEAKEKIEEANLLETIELLYTDMIVTNSELNEESFKEKLRNHNIEVEDIRIGTFIIITLKNGETYINDAENGKFRKIGNEDIFVAYYNNTKTLKFASKENKLPEINKQNGDEYYGNIKGTQFKSLVDDGADESSRHSDSPWDSHANEIVNVEFINTIKPLHTQVWFYKFSCLEKIDITNLDTSECINMRGLFSACFNLKQIDGIEKIDTSKVSNMMHLFENCKSLTNIDVGNFDTGNVKYMQNLFSDCSNLKSININNFNTKNVTNMSCIFFNCQKLEKLDVSKFNTENVTDMSYMFFNCQKLEKLDVSKFNTKNVTNMRCMFYDCQQLEELNVSQFNTENVTDMYAMFWRCQKLKSLDISNWNTSNVTNMYCLFARCELLEADCSNWNVQNVSNHESFVYLASTKIKQPNWK